MGVATHHQFGNIAFTHRAAGSQRNEGSVLGDIFLFYYCGYFKNNNNEKNLTSFFFFPCSDVLKIMADVFLSVCFGQHVLTVD